MLSQEKAFWQLTVKNGTVLVVRVLLSLLILGIDLAPILTKLTGRTSVHDIRAHATTTTSTSSSGTRRTSQSTGTASRPRPTGGCRDIQLESALFRAEQEADVARTRVQRQADGDARHGRRQRRGRHVPDRP